MTERQFERNLYDGTIKRMLAVKLSQDFIPEKFKQQFFYRDELFEKLRKEFCIEEFYEIFKNLLLGR
jgi:hypothetical protein